MKMDKDDRRSSELTMFTHGVNMLQQNVNTTALLTFPYSAQTRIVVKARVSMRTQAYTRSDLRE